MKPRMEGLLSEYMELIGKTISVLRISENLSAHCTESKNKSESKQGWNRVSGPRNRIEREFETILRKSFKLSCKIIRKYLNNSLYVDAGRTVICIWVIWKQNWRWDLFIGKKWLK